MVLQTMENRKEPLPLTGVMAPVVSFTSYHSSVKKNVTTFKRMQKKIANVRLEFCNLKSPSPEIREINQ